MPSHYALIEDRLSSQISTALPDAVLAQTHLFDRLYDFSEHISRAVSAWIVDTGLNDQDRGIVYAMQDGLEVAIYSLGQIVSQSGDPREIGLADRLERLQSGSVMLRSIADLALDHAVSLETSYGFRPEDYRDFDSPRIKLHFTGNQVSLGQHPLDPPSDKPGGCPFKRNMERLYIPLIPAVLNLYEARA